MRRITYGVALVAALALLTTACASDKNTGLPAGPTSPPAGETCDGTIDMNAALKFVPEECTITVGTTVTWTTVGALPHTATAEPNAPVQFDSGQIDTGGTFEFTFETAGEIAYYCKLHAAPGARAPGTMIGTITVEEA